MHNLSCKYLLNSLNCSIIEQNLLYNEAKRKLENKKYVDYPKI